MAELTYRTNTPVAPTETTNKSQPLTHEEMDGNFKSLDDDVQFAKELAFAYTIVFS